MDPDDLTLLYIHTTLPSHRPHELYATLVRKSATSDEVDATCKFHQHGGRNQQDLITSLPPTELHKQITSYIVTRKGDQSFYVVIPSHPTKQKVDGTIPSHLVPRPNSC